MKEYIIAFKARSETLRFSSILSRLKIFHTVITTPRNITTSCSISVKIRANNLDVAKKILVSNGFYTFLGIFSQQ